MGKEFKGIGVGRGIGIAKAFLLEDPIIKFEENSRDAEKEISDYLECRKKVEQQIQNLIEVATQKISPEKGEIFQAHLAMAQDEEIQNEIEGLIKRGKSKEWAINEVFEKHRKVFESMDIAYFKERASDIKDIRRRFLACACNVELPDLLLINEPCIIVAHDLTPSETAVLNKKYIKGFATDIGGATSHSAIMAKTLEIPAIVSLKEITKNVKDGELMAIDAGEGIVEINLDEAKVKEWENRMAREEENKRELELFKTAECALKCGTKFHIRGNIGQPKDLAKVMEYGGRGVGLFRSEFLYMESQD